MTRGIINNHFRAKFVQLKQYPFLLPIITFNCNHFATRMRRNLPFTDKMLHVRSQKGGAVYVSNFSVFYIGTSSNVKDDDDDDDNKGTVLGEWRYSSTHS
jgi:hypothetical protein